MDYFEFKISQNVKTVIVRDTDVDTTISSS